jgi:hypothetical protein
MVSSKTGLPAVGYSHATETNSKIHTYWLLAIAVVCRFKNLWAV